MYYDSVNSTENKVYLTGVGVNHTDTRNMTFEFSEYLDTTVPNANDLKDILQENYNENVELNEKVYFDLGVIKLPDAESIPSTSVSLNSDTAANLSSVGIQLHLYALGLSNSVDDINVNYVALEYADGTRYVIEERESDIRDTNYELITDGQTVTYCFNRLVDMEQVAKLIVNDIELAIILNTN